MRAFIETRQDCSSLPDLPGYFAPVLADLNNDGWTDIAVANDSWPNFLFLNKKDGTFQDASFVSGIAASEDGRYEAGMGIDAADVTGHGYQDIYITHLDFELNRLYTTTGTAASPTLHSAPASETKLSYTAASPRNLSITTTMAGRTSCN